MQGERDWKSKQSKIQIMALSNVVFEVAQYGLGAIATGNDHVSALLLSGNAPIAWGTRKVKSYTDIESVQRDGITNASAMYGLAYYHISEFFRISKGATLYVGFGLGDGVDMAELLYSVSNGAIKQIGVFDSRINAVQSIWQAIADYFASKFAPIVVVMGYDPPGFQAADNLLDLSNLFAKNVSVVAFGDGGNRGAQLAASLGRQYIPAVGTVLGLISKSAVHENIGWIESCNISDGAEFTAPIYVTGTNGYSDNTTSLLDTKQYLVPRKYAGYGGVYIEKDHTAITTTNDFANIRNNRVIGKAIRGIRQALLPSLKSPMYVDDDGKLDVGTIGHLKSKASKALEQMKRDREISTYNIAIDTNQRVLQTKVLVIDSRVVPVGSSDEIRVRLQFDTAVNFQ